MSFKHVEAARGVAWISESAHLLLRNPTPFALMGLVIGVIALVPVLGTLALAILGPALYGGIMYAAREQSAGRTVDFQQLFSAFQQPGKLPKMLMLCLPGIAAGVLIAMLLVMFVGGAMLAAGVSAATDSNALIGASLGGGGLILGLIVIAIMLVAYALVFFAIPQVMLRDVEPITAMKQSAQAVQKNIGAVLVFIASLFLAVLVIHLLIGWASIALAHLLICTVALPVVSTALMIASNEVFPRATDGDTSSNGSGDDGNDAPPPPSPSLEV